MHDEYNALISNGTWNIFVRPLGINIVRSMWLFCDKYNVDGTLSHYKARLVANMCSQQKSIDYDETFSLVVKPATIRTILSIVISRHLPIQQLVVKNALLTVTCRKIFTRISLQDFRTLNTRTTCATFNDLFMA